MVIVNAEAICYHLLVSGIISFVLRLVDRLTGKPGKPTVPLSPDVPGIPMSPLEPLKPWAEVEYSE